MFSNSIMASRNFYVTALYLDKWNAHWIVMRTLMRILMSCKFEFGSNDYYHGLKANIFWVCNFYKTFWNGILLMTVAIREDRGIVFL